jgi:hypothetical protein
MVIPRVRSAGIGNGSAGANPRLRRLRQEPGAVIQGSNVRIHPDVRRAGIDMLANKLAPLARG